MGGENHEPSPEGADESMWTVDDNTAQDPEEQRVIYCALDSYLQYAKVSFFNVTHMRRQNFYALPQAHWMMLAGPPFNYLDTLDSVDRCIRSNAGLAEAIVNSGLRSIAGPTDSADGAPPPSGSDLALPPQWVGCAKHADVDKARSTLRQFYRDWSAEGASERAACYGPVKRALTQEREYRREAGSSDRLNVLVPGAGLARLMFDLCLDGHNVEGNEISYHQLLASSYILNVCDRPGAHTVHPWIHTFSNHKTRTNHLRGYAVPDVHCAAEMARAGDRAGTMEMTAADFLCYYGGEARRETYDAVASVFFLDTAPNLIRYLQVLYRCLKPGGVLINVGPLLWHFENNPPGHHHHDDDDADEGESTTYNNGGGGGGGFSNGIADPGSFELSDDEVMALVERIGFEVEWRETGVEAPYIQDPDSMLQTVYRASCWVARRPVKENEHRAWQP